MSSGATTISTPTVEPTRVPNRRKAHQVSQADPAIAGNTLQSRYVISEVPNIRLVAQARISKRTWLLGMYGLKKIAGGPCPA
jgi:hypothetical protein